MKNRLSHKINLSEPGPIIDFAFVENCKKEDPRRPRSTRRRRRRIPGAAGGRSVRDAFKNVLAEFVR